VPLPLIKLLQHGHPIFEPVGPIQGPARLDWKGRHRNWGKVSRRVHMLWPNIINFLTRLVSSGIGFATVQNLARCGAKVYIASRNKSKVMDAMAKLEAQGLGSGQVVWLKLELSDPRLVLPRIF
jgi:hypothetical protein